MLQLHTFRIQYTESSMFSIQEAFKVSQLRQWNTSMSPSSLLMKSVFQSKFYYLNHNDQNSDKNNCNADPETVRLKLMGCQQWQ